MGGHFQYGRSKLVLEYAVRHLAALPMNKGHDGHPKVIVDTTCPGMCQSELGRQFKENSIVLRILTWVMFTLVARTTEHGSNSLTTALTATDDLNGEMWKNDRKYPPGPMCATEEGVQFGDRVWNEVRQLILRCDPETKAVLQ